MTLGEKIKLLRNEQNMTQPELADKAGIEQSYLSKLENDKGSPSFQIISRIASSLGLTGMELVSSLSQDYIENQLSHLPEVAAEYESVRLTREIKVKRRFYLSSLALIFGAGLALLGFNAVFFPERAYDYRSPGIILEGENDNLFQLALPRAGDVFTPPTDEQVRAANERMELMTLVSYSYLGKTFIQEVEGGRRIFEEYSTRGVERRENDILLALGVMAFLTGLLSLGTMMPKPKPD